MSDALFHLCLPHVRRRSAAIFDPFGARAPAEKALSRLWDRASFTPINGRVSSVLAIYAIHRADRGLSADMGLHGAAMDGDGSALCSCASAMPRTSDGDTCARNRCDKVKPDRSYARAKMEASKHDS